MYLIKNATVHIGNGTVLQQSDVLVEGKVIKEVGKNLSAEVQRLLMRPDAKFFRDLSIRFPALVQWEFQDAIWTIMKQPIQSPQR